MSGENKFMEDLLRMIAEDYPTCGHKTIELKRLPNPKGYFWNCNECLSSKVIEHIFDGEEDDRPKE